MFWDGTQTRFSHNKRKGTLRIVNAWARVYKPTAATHLANRIGKAVGFEASVSARIS